MTEALDGNAPEPAPKTSFKQKLKHYILHPELSSRQVAMSFAIGFSVSLNPLIGLHTGLIVMLCLLFRRLHMPIMFMSAFINNPWTMVPIATASVGVGNLLLGRGLALNMKDIHWASIGWRSFTTHEGFGAMFRMLEPILAPYLLGGFALSALAIPFGYYFMLKTANKLRGMHLHMPHIHKEKPKQGD